MRIIHPQHPLAGEWVEVVRVIRGRHPERWRWVIGHRQLGTLTIPFRWATADPAAIETEAESAALRVSSRSLLVLAKLVQILLSPLPEEEGDVDHLPAPRTTPAWASPYEQATSTTATTAEPLPGTSRDESRRRSRPAGEPGGGP